MEDFREVDPNNNGDEAMEVGPEGGVMGAVMRGVVDVVPAYDPIGYAGGHEPVPVVEEREVFDPIAQGV